MTQFYIGCKQIEAWPETRDSQEGYAVKYPDGYISWSPKETFESSYLPQGDDPTRITQEMVDAFIVCGKATKEANHAVLLTTLKNGFTMITDSACVDPNNFDIVKGHDIALKDAENKVWEYLGFMLATARNGLCEK